MTLTQLIPRFHLSKESMRGQLTRRLGVGGWDAVLRQSERARHRPSDTDLRQMLEAYVRGEPLRDIARVWVVGNANRLGQLLAGLDPEGWPMAKEAARQARARARERGAR